MHNGHTCSIPFLCRELYAYNVLTDDHFDFQKGKSCVMNLLSYWQSDRNSKGKRWMGRQYMCRFQKRLLIEFSIKD